MHNREKITKQDMYDIIAQCRIAHWASAANLKRHWKRHKNEGWLNMEQYNGASNIINRADRDIYLSVRAGRLMAIFHGQYKSGGTAAAVVVDVADQKIISIHKHSGNINGNYDDVPAQKINIARGMMKWFGRKAGA